MQYFFTCLFQKPFYENGFDPIDFFQINILGEFIENNRKGHTLLTWQLANSSEYFLSLLTVYLC